MTYLEALKQLNETGKFDCASWPQALAVSKMSEKHGKPAHANPPLNGHRPFVELCQGAHCHCRY